jgi:hypothetical protein
MKTKDKIETKKDFDTVETFRKIKEEISNEMANMSTVQIKAYLKEGSEKFRNSK